MGDFQKVFQPQYRRSLNHNYLVVRKPEDAKDDYQLTMMTENRITGLLAAECRECEGKTELYYEISSLQPLSRVYEHKEIGWEEVRHITEEILEICGRLQEYLLDDTHIVLEPEQIYLNMDDHKLSLLFFPYAKISEEENFTHLAEYFLDRIDHRDMKAAMFAYRFYKIVRRENFVPDDIRRALAETEDAGGEEREKPDMPFGKCFGIDEPRRAEENRSTGEILRTEKGRSTGGTMGTAKSRKADGALFFGESEDEEGKKPGMITIVSAGMILIAFSLFLKLIPGIRAGAAGKLTAIVLLLLGMAGMCFGLIKKVRGVRGSAGDARRPDDDIFAGMTPRRPGCLNPTERSGGERNPAERSPGEGNPAEWSPGESNPAGWPVVESDAAGGQEEDLYGKTVFMEPEKEELHCILREKGKKKEYPMRSFPFTIGKVRECVDLALPDSSVSRIHARILREDDQLYLQDCRSTNGTFLNGMQLEVEEMVPIGREDEIGIGKLRFELI